MSLAEMRRRFDDLRSRGRESLTDDERCEMFELGLILMTGGKPQ